jgi:hypothetical protein
LSNCQARRLAKAPLCSKSRRNDRRRLFNQASTFPSGMTGRSAEMVLSPDP